MQVVFVPFLGNLFSIRAEADDHHHESGRFRPLSREPFFNENGEPKLDSVDGKCFRPLSWGLFFNFLQETVEVWEQVHGQISSPFLGTFFQLVNATE